MSDTTPDSEQSLSNLETQVLWNRLQATAEEMNDAAERLAFSVSIREGGDVSTAVMTADGKAVSLSRNSVPVLSGAVARTTRIVLEDHFPPEELNPGDAIITNDPWIGGGHLSDVIVLEPVFFDDELVGITGSLGHIDDVGGRMGGWSIEASQVYEEGIQIPPMKLYDRGEFNESVETLVRTNVRLPDQALGDIEALRSANTLGAGRIRDLVEERGIETFNRITEEVIDRSERALRRELRELDDGTYEGEMNYNIKEFDITIEVAVTIDGDDLTIDFTGTSDEVDGGINCPFGNVVAVTEYIVKCMLAPDLPNSEGFFEPIDVTAPEGSILNCTRPHATMARHLAYVPAEDCLVSALGQVVPEQAITEMAGLQLHTIQGEDERGNPFIVGGWNIGGLPARANKDGIGAVIFPYNGKNVPVEIYEQYSALRIEETSFVTDSEGAGEYRSGPAHRLAFHNPTEKPMQTSITSEKADHPPAGFGGGHSGQRATGTSSREGKDAEINGSGALEPGETLTFTTATPGGYGDPTDRDEALIERDIQLGYITEERAREVYGYDP
jgi:N-methylhydantoinase B/oxoprolinase/acetone carboxylase alpha subunit